MKNKCDKCGQEVLPHEDAGALEFLLCQAIETVFIPSRHIFPVVKDGKMVCEGSPSRAQYLPGQPRDSRTAYPYIPAKEQEIRAAFAELQKKRIAA